MCVCYAFVCVCLLLPCGHLLGKGWPLGSHLWCSVVSLLLSHWYPGSGVALDCIDSWSLPSFVLSTNLFKLRPWVQKLACPGGHMFIKGLYRETMKKYHKYSLQHHPQCCEEEPQNTNNCKISGRQLKYSKAYV